MVSIAIGEKRGEKRGIAIGEKNVILSLYIDGLISKETAAERLNINMDELYERAKELREKK